MQRKQRKGIILTSWFPLIKRKLNLQSSSLLIGRKVAKAAGRREKRKVVTQNSKKSMRDEKHGENPERGNNNIQVTLWSYKIKQYII